MTDQNPVLHPKAKNAKPQGQLASMLQNRGWDEYGGVGGEISRSSSAPPTQLLMPNNDFGDIPQANGGFYAKPGQNGLSATAAQQNWGLWGGNSPGARQEQNLYAPKPATSATRASAWSNPSPLRPLPDTASPLRRTFDSQNDYGNMAPGLVRPKSVNPSYRDNVQDSHDDEMRMKALLNAALDSREDLFEGPIPRAASTPPSRLQFANPRFSKDHQQEVAYQMQHLALNN
ncbi:hypothetical protein HDU91_000513, partial [Kappamyces sp. JEL0680]